MGGWWEAEHPPLSYVRRWSPPVLVQLDRGTSVQRRSALSREWPSGLCQRWCWGSGCGLSSFTCSSVLRPPPSLPPVVCTGAAGSEPSGIPMCRWNWVSVFPTAGLGSGCLGLLSHLLCLQSFIVSVSSKFFFFFFLLCFVLVFIFHVRNFSHSFQNSLSFSPFSSAWAMFCF